MLTGTNTLARTGSAHYTATILGSGERYADAAPLTLGTAAIDIDFAAMTLAGLFNADAKTSNGTLIDLPTLTFGGELFNTYAFQSYFIDDQTHTADGEIQGRLYGPSGKIGGSIPFMRQVPGGTTIEAGYAGVRRYATVMPLAPLAAPSKAS